MQGYANKARSLVFNMKDPKNPKLKVRILESDLTPLEVVTMDAKDMASDKMKKEREETQKQNLDARRTDWD